MCPACRPWEGSLVASMKKGGGHPGHDGCRRLSFPSVAAPRGTLGFGIVHTPSAIAPEEVHAGGIQSLSVVCWTGRSNLLENGMPQQSNMTCRLQLFIPSRPATDFCNRSRLLTVSSNHDE